MNFSVPRAFFRRLLIGVFILAVLAGAGLYVVLDTPIVSSWLLRQAIEKNLYDVNVVSLEISRQQFRLPDTLTFSDLDLVLESEGHEYQFSVPSLECQGLSTLLKNDIAIISQINDAHISSSAFEIEHLSSKINYTQQGQEISLNGTIAAKTVNLNSFMITGLTTEFAGDNTQLLFKNINGDSYNGNINGEVLLQYQEDLMYKVKMQATHLDLVKLVEFNPGVFSQAQGKLDGRVLLSGKRDQLQTVDVQANIPESGKLKASILAVVSQYIPVSQEKEQLDFLIKTGGMVPVEVAAFQVKSVTQRKLVGLIKIVSRQLNLDLNLPIDINLSGDLNSILKNWGNRLH